MRGLVFIAAFLFFGCQYKPTKVVNQEPVVSEAGSLAQRMLQGDPVILDVRPAFEFNLSHVPESVNVRWEDFSQRNPRSRGLLQPDLFALARRLSLIGVSPERKVLVLGKGSEGAGEEGRVAWTLKLLGVRDVVTLRHSVFREMNATREMAPIQNSPYWKPDVQDHLVIEANEVGKMTSVPSVVFLDVRTPGEFQTRHKGPKPAMQATVQNIEWTQFFDTEGRPSEKAVALLKERGVEKDSALILISSHGVRSGAVTYALNVLGFKNVRNFAGGYEQLPSF